MKRYTLFLQTILWLAVLWSCAQPAAPKGGPKDMQAPALHKKKYSTPNEMTNFAFEEIILTFDEWVKVQDVFNQVVISPPLKRKPDIKVKNKSVVLTFKELLKDSTTYVIQYGKAIRDITEGNTAEMTFVFSTGNALDSLEIEGRVTDYLTGKPVPDALVMLYRSMEDSMPILEKPYYFGRTNKSGAYRIKYIRGGRYRLFALKDANNNYKFDQVKEKIDFKGPFELTDTSNLSFELGLFENDRPLAVLEQKEISYGQGIVTFNKIIEKEGRALHDFKIKGLPETTVYTLNSDTLKYWYNRTADSSVISLLYYDNKLLDTLKHKALFKAPFLEENPNPILTNLTHAIAPQKTVNLQFDALLTQVDSTLIELYIDSTKLVRSKTDTSTFVSKDTLFKIDRLVAQRDTADARNLLVYGAWKPENTYKVYLLPGAVLDVYGRKNKDTIVTKIKVEKAIEYSLVKLTLKGTVDSIPSFVQLVASSGAVFAQKKIGPSTEVLFENVLPGAYTIRVVEDKNQNFRWDTGDYLKGKYPEKIVSGAVFKLQPGWEQEETINLSEQ